MNDKANSFYFAWLRPLKSALSPCPLALLRSKCVSVESAPTMREVQADGAPLRALCSGLDVLAGELSSVTVGHYLFAFSDPFRRHEKHSFFERYELRVAKRAIVLCVCEAGDTLAIYKPLHGIAVTSELKKNRDERNIPVSRGLVPHQPKRADHCTRR